MNLFLKKQMKNLNSTLYRPLGLVLALVWGGYLILKHSTLDQTLFGMALWGVALVLTCTFMSSVPGWPVFSQTQLRFGKVKKEWNWIGLLLASTGTLIVLGLSNLSLQKGWWIPLVLSLAAFAAGIFFLERHSSAFSHPQPGPTGIRHWYGRIPWPEILVLLWGSFFLFYRLGDIPGHVYSDSMWSLQEAHQYMVGAYPTPYTTEWGGFAMMPIMLMGLAFKLIGFSYFKGVFFYGLLNLAGFLFFFWFLRFFLPQGPALAGALLYASAHYVDGVARMPFLGVSMLLPWETATLFFFARAVEKGKPQDYLWFGAVLAFCLQTYLPARFLPILFVTSLLIFAVSHFREMLRQKIQWVLGGTAFLLWYLPMISYFLQNKENLSNFNVRVSQVNLLPGLFHSGNFTPLCENFQRVLQTLTLTAGDNPVFSLGPFPLLSPWEGLCLLAGLGWCLARLFKPAAVFLLLGLLGGLLVPIVTIDPHIMRGLAAAPFLYALVGIGLDRLSRVATSPLGARGTALRFFFFAVFLAFSIGWQYDIYFRQIPKSRNIWMHDQGFNMQAGKILAQYPLGWDVYVLPDEFFGFDISVFSPNGSMGNTIPFYPKSSLPLKIVPAKGAVVFLPDEFGKAFKDWMEYYYPHSMPRKIVNPFGNVQFWLWEITPAQIQEAIKKGNQPPLGLQLTCLDSQGRKLGQWRIPTLFSGITYWFRQFQGKSFIPNDKPLLFEVKGLWNDPDSKQLVLKGGGPAEGRIGGKRIRFKMGQVNEVKLPSRAGGVPIELSYTTLPSDFYMDLEQKNADGWNLVTSGNLRPSTGAGK